MLKCNPKGHDIHKFEPTLPEDASTQFSAFLTDCFPSNVDPPMSPHPTPEGHDYHNFESTLPEDALTQASAFPVLWFVRRFMKISPKFSIITN